MELTSVSAIRGATPQRVLDAVVAWLESAGIGHRPMPSGDAGPGDLTVAPERVGWTTVTWPSYFAPRDVEAARALSQALHTVVLTVTTTDDEGWSQHLFGCGTALDRFHSYPAGLAWDDGDVSALAQEWSGDFELEARVLGVEACTVRRHFCQATPATRGHPGRDRDGYLGLWRALGIRVPEQAYAALSVAPTWSALTPG